jgi:Co/Zn/Cd efflux system component
VSVFQQVPLYIFSGFLFLEVMGAVVSVLIIWVVTIVLVYMAVQRVLKPDYVIDATVMLIMALLSIVFNVVYVPLTFFWFQTGA